MNKKEDELKLWTEWKKSPTDQNLSNLLNYLNPFIMKRVNMFASAQVPRPVLEAKAKLLAVEAIQNYNPKSPASLGTYTYIHLKRLNRFVGDIQNIGKIPENRRLKIQHFKDTKAELIRELGREPSSAELAEALGWPLAEVVRMESEMAVTTTTSAFDSELITAKTPNKLQRKIRNIYYDLSPEEQLVYEYSLGLKGKPKLKDIEIAKRTGMSPSKVSRIKKSIAKKIDDWRS